MLDAQAIWKELDQLLNGREFSTIEIGALLIDWVGCLPGRNVIIQG